MAYTLFKPYSEEEKNNFIIKHNHNEGLEIEETDDCLYALKANEIMMNGKPAINPNYKEELSKARKEWFERSFFQTSLGWIRRSVTMKDGSKKDFLADLLLPIKAGLELGQEVEIIVYREPNFYIDLTQAYMETLQEHQNATMEFIAECLQQTIKDFKGE